MTAADVGGRILALRTGKGLTQRDLAEPNYTAAYVSSVENGHRVPSSDALAHFAARLSVDVTQLTTGRHPGDALSIEIDLLEEVRPPLWFEQRAADPAEHSVRRATAEVVLGRLRLAAGAPDDAVACFDRARRLIPSTLAHLRAPAVAGLALCARLQGDPGYAAYLLTGFRDELQRAGLPIPLRCWRSTRCWRCVSTTWARTRRRPRRRRWRWPGLPAGWSPRRWRRLAYWPRRAICRRRGRRWRRLPRLGWRRGWRTR